MDRRQFLSRLLLGTALIAIFTILINAEATLPWLWDKVSTVLSPILGGIAIAFILSIPSKRIEKTLEGRLGKGVRLISLVLSVALIILFLSLVIALVVPEFINACSILIDSLKAFASDESFWERIDLSAIPFVNDMLGGVDDSITTLAELLESKIQEFSAPILSFTIQSLISVIQGSVSFFVAAVFACYFIMNREMLSRHIRKVLSLLLPESRIGYLVHLERIASSSFSRFIIAQVTEACIIGVLCFAGMLVLRLPYAAAISAFTGLMALIPIYGAIIGAIVGAFIIAVISPITRPSFSSGTLRWASVIVGALNHEQGIAIRPHSTAKAGNASRGRRPQAMVMMPVRMQATAINSARRLPPPHAMMMPDPTIIPIPQVASAIDAMNPSPPKWL